MKFTYIKGSCLDYRRGQKENAYHKGQTWA